MTKLPDMTPEELEAAKGKPHIAADPIEELAKLSRMEYEQIREAKAKELNVRVGVLDKEVDGKRQGETEAHGRGIKLYEPEPWHEPVSGAEALSAAAAAIMRHMVIRQ